MTRFWYTSRPNPHPNLPPLIGATSPSYIRYTPCYLFQRTPPSPSPCEFFSMLAHPPCPSACPPIALTIDLFTLGHQRCPPLRTLFYASFHTILTKLFIVYLHTHCRSLFTTVLFLFYIIIHKQLLQVVLQHAIHFQVCALPDLKGIPSTLVTKTASKIISP